MVFQWKRIIADKTAGQSSADTTETQVGSGLAVPNWARYILQGIVSLQTLALTNAENVSGYVKITNDENTIEPMNMPLPMMDAPVAAAVGSALITPITFPILQPVTPKDTVRAYFALDNTTTGVHVVDVDLLFLDHELGMKIAAQRCALTVMGDGLTDGTAVDISTLAKRTKNLLGVWAYQVAPTTLVAADGLCGHLTITSNAKDWQTQQLRLNMSGGGLGADFVTMTRPVVYGVEKLLKYFDGVHTRILPEEFPIGDVQAFTLTPFNDRDINDGSDPSFRAALIWSEK